MLRTIKTGKQIGIAEQVQGLTVDVHPHPRFRNSWGFETRDNKGKTVKWVASDYAFVEDGIRREDYGKMGN